MVVLFNTFEFFLVKFGYRQIPEIGLSPVLSLPEANNGMKPTEVKFISEPGDIKLKNSSGEFSIILLYEGIGFDLIGRENLQEIFKELSRIEVTGIDELILNYLWIGVKSESFLFGISLYIQESVTVSLPGIFVRVVGLYPSVMMF